MRYDWGDGKGKKHSRPKRSGQQLQQAKDAKLLADPNYFTAPQTLGQALTEGGRAADLVYGPQIAQTQLQQRQAPAWFDQYRQTLLTPQQVQAQYQPAIEQSQKDAAATGQTLGLQGPAGETDALAAKAREALANLGTATLSNAQQADTSYYQGRQGVAQAAQVGAQAQLGSQLGALQGQRGAAVAQYVSDARQAERRYGLDTQHQNVENKAFDVKVADAAGVDPITGKKLPPKDRKDVITSGPFAGYTKGQVRGMDPAKKAKLRAQSKKSGGSDVITTGPLAGKTKGWVRDHPDEAAKLVSAGGDGSPKTYTNEQHTNAKRDLRKAVGKIQDKLGGKKTAPDSFWKQAYSALVNELDMDPAVARAAVQLVRLGKVGPNTRGTLESDYGVLPSDYPKGTKRKKPPAYKVPGRPGTAPSGTGDGQGNDSRRPT